MELSYFNARVRGLRGRLLKRADYEAFLKLESETQYVERLRSTPYGPYIETAGARFAKPDEIISSALRANLADTLALLWKTAPEEARPLLKAVFSIWEVYDLKTIIRGISKGIRREDIMNALIPAGEFNQGALNTLLSSKDVPDVVQFLITWGSPYGKPMRAGLESYRRNGGILEIELNLDLFIFPHLLSALKEGAADHSIIRETVALRIDLINMLTLVKAAGEGYSREGIGSFFIEGGALLRRSDFLKLSEIKERGELISALDAHVRDADIKSVLTLADPEEMALMEERLDEVIQRRLQRLSVADPLSIALSASFIFMKVREIKNLRLVQRGKAFRIPEEELRRLIIYPV